MKIMNGDRLVAYSVDNALGIPYKVVAVDSVEQNDLPLGLFGLKSREVNYLDFLDWVKTRCFPENRVDKDNCLRELGLDKYDALEIVRRTGARMFYLDNIWVDWS